MLVFYAYDYLSITNAAGNFIVLYIQLGALAGWQL
jgi:hypothetical protein